MQQNQNNVNCGMNIAGLRHNREVQPERLRQLLEQVAAGKITPARAQTELRQLPFENLGFAQVDHHRALRNGTAEVIFAAGKTPRQVVAIAAALRRKQAKLLITRATPAIARAVKRRWPQARYYPASGIIGWRAEGKKNKSAARMPVLIVSAGTSDHPVAEEAMLTAEALGCRTELIQDVGVAGLHRLLAYVPRLQQAGVVIVVAGMEGALPSVVGGLTQAPVIAVPTRIGYGTGLHGVGALRGMLNACASNVGTVNIDNGFGAGYVAAQIMRLAGTDQAKQ